MQHAITWFEIPVQNIDRATDFYGTILNAQLNRGELGGYEMAFFPTTGVGGALVQGQGYVPTEHGVVTYLFVGEDVGGVLSRVEQAGGSILQPKTLITEEIGYMAFIRDSEGNRVGLHGIG